jgi:GNAT superfamily N-acetyltransferase
MHRFDHDEIVNGVPARQMKSDKVIWQQGGDCISVVNAFSPRCQRIRAEKIGSVANKEMHYTFGIFSEDERPDTREIHLFLYRSNGRDIGLSILEKRSGISHNTWEEYTRVNKDLEKQEPIWSLIFIWVHKKHRRRGIAKTVFVEAVRHLGISINDAGLYTPLSKDGEAFARSVFPKDFLIAR